jgi:hypothetical protein
MDIQTLKQHCENATKQTNTIGLSGPAMITLQMRENKKCPKRRKIFRNRGPFGNVVAYGFDGYDTVIFNAQEVLDFIDSVMEVTHD